MVHYVGADMATEARNRAEEERAMATFDHGFARRHAAAFHALHQRFGLDYFGIDCAETRSGELLIFEVASAMVIHAMDSPQLYPYKQAQMRKTFAAFHGLLDGVAASGLTGATIPEARLTGATIPEARLTGAPGAATSPHWEAEGAPCP